MSTETLSFQAEVQQLLNLMIHSLYSNKEIFVRELVSNASDALDRLRFEEVTNRNLLASDKENSIQITAYPETKRLVIEDNGIGMSREEVISNLGTIASSGTKKFLENLKEQDKKDANLIGQFGVGFYSAFMVAEKVIVDTKSAKDGEAWLWESTGTGTYNLSPSTRTERGTRVEIFLKEEDAEFADDWRVKGIVHKYSDYITYPVYLNEAEGKQTRLNKTTPVWVRNKKDNKPEDYFELYKQVSHDFEDPLLYEHTSSEGLMPFSAVVFVPKQPPFDLYMREATHGLHLYVKRVSIIEKCKELIPEYLRFVSGVVETDELPLNVSREMLQQNTKLPTIKKQIVKKILGALANLAKEEKDKYLDFYDKFGSTLKEGFHFDRDNQEALSELVRFRSSKTGATEWVSLQEYIDRKAEGQTEIYYISAPSYEIAAKSPQLEALIARNLEVLFFVDPIDEWFVMDYPKHKDFNFKSPAKGDLNLQGIGQEPSTENKSAEVPPEELAGLLEAIRSHFSQEIQDVRVSNRLTDSPCCLVAEENGMSAQMERIMKMTNKSYTGAKKIMEINPTHQLIKNLVTLTKNPGSSQKLSEWIEILFDTALMAEGSAVRNPGDFARKLTNMLTENSTNPR